MRRETKLKTALKGLISPLFSFPRFQYISANSCETFLFKINPFVTPHEITSNSLSFRHIFNVPLQVLCAKLQRCYPSFKYRYTWCHNKTLQILIFILMSQLEVIDISTISSICTSTKVVIPRAAYNCLFAK